MNSDTHGNDAIVRPEEIAARLKMQNVDLSGAMLRLRRRGLHMFRVGRSFVTTEADLRDYILEQRQGGAR